MFKIINQAHDGTEAQFIMLTDSVEMEDTFLPQLVEIFVNRIKL